MKEVGDMAEKKRIDPDLREYLSELSRLRGSLPVDAPEYKEVEREYRKLSDLLEKAVEIAIDMADSEYDRFTESMKEAFEAIREAQKDIGKISKAIQVAAKVIDMAGKIAGIV